MGTMVIDEDTMGWHLGRIILSYVVSFVLCPRAVAAMARTPEAD